MSFHEINCVAEEIEPLRFGLAWRAVYDEQVTLGTIKYRVLRHRHLILARKRRRTVICKSAALRNGHVTISRTPW